MALEKSELEALVRKILTNKATPDELAYAYGVLENPNVSNVERQAIEAALRFIGAIK